MAKFCWTNFTKIRRFFKSREFGANRYR